VTAEPDKSLILILPLLRFFLEIMMEHAGALPEVPKKTDPFFCGSLILKPRNRNIKPISSLFLHVLFGTKMIALFLGANGVLHFCKTSGTAVILVGVIQKRFTLLYARFDGSHPFFVVCLFLNDFQLVSSFYRMYPNLNWQQTSCFICRFFFLCQCQVFELQNKSDKQDRLKPSCFS